MGNGLLECRAAFHVHTYLSHDSRGSIEEIAAAARSLGIDTVILNDHHAEGNILRSPRGVRHGVLFVPGLELRAGPKGSILAFPVEEDFPRKLSPAERVAEIARQGALSVYGHCEELEDWELWPFQGFEVYNLHAEFLSKTFWGLSWRFLFLFPDAFFESSVTTPTGNLAALDRELARGRRLAVLGGHDAHANVRVLGALGGVIGTYPEILRLFSNHILVREWNVEGIAEGVRAGRTFLSFDFLGDATGASFTYGSPADPRCRRAGLGEEAPHSPGSELEVVVPADGAEVRVVRNGVEELRAPCSRRWAGPLRGPGVVRVEVYLKNRLWIVSSPLYITAPRLDGGEATQRRAETSGRGPNGFFNGLKARE